jgi:gamma-butyrobetaine dioxygenase
MGDDVKIETTPKHGVDKLKMLFRNHGQSEYIGEEVSQLEHALQAASWALTAQEPPRLIMAALCHDVGHLLMLAGYDLEPMEHLGAHKHAVAGADWLEKELGVGKDVTDPVRLHVAAKRYQCYKIPRYVTEHLSTASQRTLELQGGPMSWEEAKQFERHPRFHEALRVRAYDNAAKIRGQKTWTLDEALKAAGYEQ